MATPSDQDGSKTDTEKDVITKNERTQLEHDTVVKYDGPFDCPVCDNGEFREVEVCVYVSTKKDERDDGVHARIDDWVASCTNVSCPRFVTDETIRQYRREKSDLPVDDIVIECH